MIINGLHKKIKKNTPLLLEPLSLLLNSLGRIQRKAAWGFVFVLFFPESFLNTQLYCAKGQENNNWEIALFFKKMDTNSGGTNIWLRWPSLLLKSWYLEHGCVEIISGTCVPWKHEKGTSEKKKVSFIVLLSRILLLSIHCRDEFICILFIFLLRKQKVEKGLGPMLI